MSSEPRLRTASFRERAKQKLSFGFRLRNRSGSDANPAEKPGDENETSSPQINRLSWDISPNVKHEPLTKTTSEPISDNIMSVITGISSGSMDGGMEPRKKKNSVQPKGTLTHLVAERETLNSIALRYDATPSELRKLNNLMVSSMIFPGQTMYVPDQDYVPSPPVSPIHNLSTTDKGGGIAARPSICQIDSGGRKSFDVPLVGMSSEPRKSAVTVQPAVPLRPLNEEHARTLDEECYARFIKVNVKHITDGQGVVSGVLLVTPNAIMFDPNVSDALVIEHGADIYGMIAPMETVISAAMYHDIAAMKIKGVPRHEASGKGEVYHAAYCPLRELPEESKPIDIPVSGERKLSESEQVEYFRSESACSCGALDKDDNAPDLLIDDSLRSSGAVPDVIGDLPRGSDTAQRSDGSHNGSMSGSPRQQGVVQNFHIGCDPVPVPTLGSSPKDVFGSSPKDMSSRARADSDPAQSGRLKQTIVGSLSSLGSTLSSNIPNPSSIVDTTKGLFRGGPEDSREPASDPPTDPSKEQHTSGRDTFNTDRLISEKTATHDSWRWSTNSEVSVENAVQLEDKPELFKSLDELIPKPAAIFEDPPLYLCLRVGKPINKVAPKSGPIESYVKKRPKSEYWFSIPREMVDPLYAFFVQWQPTIYGGDDEIDPAERGFVVINEDEESEEDLPEGGDVDYSSGTSRLKRQMTKDWELVNLEEARRRMSLAEDECVSMPEMLDASTLLSDEHIIKLTKNLPPRCVGYPWGLVYSSDRNGFSLQSFYRRMNNVDSPILLVIKDTNDQLFGAMCSCPVRQNDHFYGTGQSFLFSWYPEFKRYNWTGNNSFFIRGEQENLAFGSGEGHFGLWMDSNLYHGSTSRCSTYDNEPLTETTDFIIKGLEAWGYE